MKMRLSRRAALAIGGVAAAASVVGISAGAANAADAAHWVGAGTSHGVGVYSGPSSADSKVGAWDLYQSDGDAVYVYCWTTGQDIGNGGDVWYGVSGEAYSWGEYGWDGYVYGAYLDGNATFDNLATRPPHC